MIKRAITISMLTAFLLISCKEKSNQENQDNPETAPTETVESVSDDIVTTKVTGKDGKVLNMRFNNTEGTATLELDGETIELNAQRAASGIWYKNDPYELRGKGNDIQLTKDGNLIFEHEDDKVNIEARNDKGDVLNMTFNNTEGTVKIYLNGGEQIELTEEKAASGIWYKNEHYKLSGKGNHYTLTKGGKTIFEN